MMPGYWEPKHKPSSAMRLLVHLVVIAIILWGLQQFGILDLLGAEVDRLLTFLPDPVAGPARTVLDTVSSIVQIVLDLLNRIAQQLQRVIPL